MRVYFTLSFPQSGTGFTLKNWLLKMGTEVQAGDPLFSYRDGAGEGNFLSPGAGLLKVYLLREGEPFQKGSELLVLSSEEAEAKALAERGLGQILTPDEYQSTLKHAESASIRLPPEA